MQSIETESETTQAGHNKKWFNHRNPVHKAIDEVKSKKWDLPVSRPGKSSLLAYA
jgi:hypothetical protein